MLEVVETTIEDDLLESTAALQMRSTTCASTT